MTQSYKYSCLSTDYRRKKQWRKNRRHWIVHRAGWHCGIRNAASNTWTYVAGFLVLFHGPQLRFRTMETPEINISLATRNLLHSSGMPSESWLHTPARWLCPPNTWTPGTWQLDPDAVIPGRPLGRQQVFWCIKKRRNNSSKQLWWCIDTQCGVRCTRTMWGSWKSSLSPVKW